jgi:hypothetical protein
MKHFLGKANKEIINAIGQLMGVLGSVKEEFVPEDNWATEDLLRAYTQLAWTFESCRYKEEEAARKRDMETEEESIASEKIPEGLSVPKIGYVSKHFVDDKGDVVFEISKATSDEDAPLLERYVALGLVFAGEHTQNRVNALAKEFGENKEFILSNAAELDDKPRSRQAKLLMLRLSDEAGKLSVTGKSQLSNLEYCKPLYLFDGSCVYIKEFRKGASVFCKTQTGFAALQDGELILKDKARVVVQNGVMSELDMSQSDLLAA